MVATKLEHSDNWRPPRHIVPPGLERALIESGLPALIGAYLVSCGPHTTLLFMSWLGLYVVPKNCTAETLPNFGVMLYGTLEPPLVVPDAGPQLGELLSGYDAFEARIGYLFRDRAYLLQAFTDASYRYNRLTDCYQRLEFLVDVVSDYLITRHLYDDPQRHSPGTLTDLRSPLVNNTFFASMAVKEEYQIGVVDGRQPLLDVDHTLAWLNLLMPRYVNRKGVTLPTSSEQTKRAKRESLQQKQILVAELLCAIHPLPASLWHKAACLPCILYRMNSLLLAEKLRLTVAREVQVGRLELPKGFKWPTLDFDWTLADVLQKAQEAAKAEEERAAELMERTGIQPVCISPPPAMNAWRAPQPYQPPVFQQANFKSRLHKTHEELIKSLSLYIGICVT
ncbi:uncharacterized protein [Dermacentor andersoni]|uniref:uncharacterized protein n=1 Tax=Dermacentor andersoni TaxID=34620 RepID=UPI002415BA4E|nr:endoribonuclease Dcr-1-like [Dermacentor andersoni]XP_054928221.1 endoribonuclease Dcr-1-like [Dermacentor andersoni]XP_054928222.1 endoribonuclease Dcr-1-like [Dermacentor andersoni]XP_054928223.1 endoribonuclease Dcr-1-like [Dermacentor andersoni]XP_054928224.1 endoribonuclease Dcr-1-like [Dermacentor andersoni]XP_054928225.1 endoribonuclease Dcr-1-like [Dermacentor andersoni]XP_054928226.1 endoribonuclease Dcr-1-like [Dermacentor andersoni]XP_054928227.1 endoribonuclease Dcr-1-like [De